MSYKIAATDTMIEVLESVLKNVDYGDAIENVNFKSHLANLGYQRGTDKQVEKAAAFFRQDIERFLKKLKERVAKFKARD